MLCWSHIFGNSLAFQWSLRTTTKNCWQDKDNCEMCKAIKPYTSQQDCSSSTYHKVRYKENAIGPNNFTEVICYNFTTNKSKSYRKNQSHWEVHIPWLAIASGFCSKHWSQNTTFRNQNTFLVFSMQISSKTREQILWRIWIDVMSFSPSFFSHLTASVVLLRPLSFFNSSLIAPPVVIVLNSFHLCVIERAVILPWYQNEPANMLFI